MFHKMLIANRGEIALRIIRACKELGVSTASVFSEADRDSLHVRFADEAICIGPPESAKSYLNIPRIISAAEIANADAIHPGYGFLAENSEFADVCENCGIKLVGPSAQVMSSMGDKVFARNSMRKAKVPVIPGSEDAISDPNEAVSLADDIGYPVILKAAAGGGGKGMRLAYDKKSLENGFRTARAEARASFGDDRLYLEKYLEAPRHIEFQILYDGDGSVIHLGERECSIQRRHQKLLEEAPSVAVDHKLRTRIGRLVVDGAKSVGYDSAGTMEFLMKDDQMYFMETNARIQVEHPVTELITGVDLIKGQIRVASGEKLGIKQDEVAIKGHAIECRINAEDPDKAFIPNPGRISAFHVPGGPGIRVDTHVYSGYMVPPYYDSMLAKVIAYGDNRAEAIARMKRALSEFVIEGVKTTIPFHLRLIQDEGFLRGSVHTAFVESFLSQETRGSG
jgi:acetyl-CoA carboxylase biotin carboxylase subunit